MCQLCGNFSSVSHQGETPPKSHPAFHQFPFPIECVKIYLPSKEQKHHFPHPKSNIRLVGWMWPLGALYPNPSSSQAHLQLLSCAGVSLLKGSS